VTVVIAGERSGSGKTTITLALLSALKSMGYGVQSFKVGPDYIDPMFHALATARPCYNLDLVLTSSTYIENCLENRTQDVELAVIEGVMGLFDGAIDPPGYGSTAMVSQQLNLPILLVVDCRSLSHSIAAIVHGYRSLDPSLNIAGVILNRVGSDRQLEILQQAIAPLNLPILGTFRREDEISLPDRYLGLTPADQLPELVNTLAKLAHLGRQNFNWPQLLPLLQVKRRSIDPIQYPEPLPQPVRIAVAKDAAFNFYYQDNLDLLTRLGAELVDWSPLHDRSLPPDIDGWYFGGGFPELFGPQLAQNQIVRSSLHQSISSGTPTYAECGGLMYLCEGITDFNGQTAPMVGILPTVAVMGKHLTLGYRTARAKFATPLLPHHAIVRGHEFHRSRLAVAPPTPLFEMKPGTNLDLDLTEFPFQEGWHSDYLHASYLHLHWGEHPEYPLRFLSSCQINCPN
jgi:cobyrinic acid a,c-diamide synthase